MVAMQFIQKVYTVLINRVC